MMCSGHRVVPDKKAGLWPPFTRRTPGFLRFHCDLFGTYFLRGDGDRVVAWSRNGYTWRMA